MQVIFTGTVVKHSVDCHLQVIYGNKKKLERKGLYNSRAIADGEGRPMLLGSVNLSIAYIYLVLNKIEAKSKNNRL